MIEEALGDVRRPYRNVRTVTGRDRTVLTRHPKYRDRVGWCDRCGRRGARLYRHPNPLRRNVVLIRCFQHRTLRFALEDPKAAPQGGRYR